MRQLSRWTSRTARGIRLTIGSMVGVACALFALPAHAQSSTVATQSPWVTATLASVSAVFILWVVAAGLFRMARKFRWVPPQRHSQVSRALQVTFGGLLLLAVLMPYLAMHHPIVGISLVLVSLLWIFFYSCRRCSGGETTPL